MITDRSNARPGSPDRSGCTSAKSAVIRGVVVNHGSSAYTELMLRSFHARHSAELDIQITVVDNASEDDTTALFAYARRHGIPVRRSGFDTNTENNSHGEILSRFVLENPDCTHYLLLDTDACFIEDDTIPTMLQELESREDAFAVAARFSPDGEQEIDEEARRRNPDLYDARLHPCCALIRNTPVFRSVVQQVGMSCVHYMWAGGVEYVDTCKLLTRVMATHGLRHILSSCLVLHFFSVSYPWDGVWLSERKAAHRDRLLAELRAAEGDGPLAKEGQVDRGVGIGSMALEERLVGSTSKTIS